VDSYPQLFAYGLAPEVPNMLVVGGVGVDGTWLQTGIGLSQASRDLGLLSP